MPKCLVLLETTIHTEVALSAQDIGTYTYRLVLTGSYKSPNNYGIRLYVRPLDKELKSFEWQILYCLSTLYF